ncbi:hypothetical protein LOTGIDRAFT_166396 [Lottia gigantea]|uniref:Single domain-containing protein n=1 Tax=Lottia gigantea TaxID=225164 RepID=V3ZY05_LOTGI|nr:hypothetical protein LOTGIDRAFT_166396 [Lottia gigantea]ESO87515.1 hypothetical protein LOTGIDRAFT_166396 [Lottia gigantea]
MRSIKTIMLYRVFFIITIISCIDGNFVYHKGKCPDNKKPGEEWMTPDCKNCVCQEWTYYCYVCPHRTIHEKFGCYIEKRDTTGASYPVCCFPYIQVCPEDKHFSKQKYKDYIDNSRQIIPAFSRK